MEMNSYMLKSKKIGARIHHAHHCESNMKFICIPEDVNLFFDQNKTSQTPLFYRGNPLYPINETEKLKNCFKNNPRLLNNSDDNINSKSCPNESRPENHRILTIIRNGLKPYTFFKMILNKNSKQSYDDFLSDISDAFGQQWENKPVLKLLTSNGKLVDGISNLFEDETCFVAIGYKESDLTCEEIQAIVADVTQDYAIINDKFYANDIDNNRRKSPIIDKISSPKIECNNINYNYVKARNNSRTIDLNRKKTLTKKSSPKYKIWSTYPFKFSKKSKMLDIEMEELIKETISTNLNEHFLDLEIIQCELPRIKITKWIDQVTIESTKRKHRENHYSNYFNYYNNNYQNVLKKHEPKLFLEKSNNLKLFKYDGRYNKENILLNNSYKSDLISNSKHQKLIKENAEKDSKSSKIIYLEDVNNCTATSDIHDSYSQNSRTKKFLKPRQKEQNKLCISREESCNDKPQSLEKSEFKSYNRNKSNRERIPSINLCQIPSKNNCSEKTRLFLPTIPEVINNQQENDFQIKVYNETSAKILINKIESTQVKVLTDSKNNFHLKPIDIPNEMVNKTNYNKSFVCFSKIKRQNEIERKIIPKKVVPFLLKQLDKNEDFNEFYILGSLLGSGNFSEVREGMESKTEKRFAVKITDKNQMKDHEDWIVEEIRIIKSCNHPNIVKIIDQFESSDKVYLIQELVKDGDLFDNIKENVKFSEKQAAVMMRDLLRALLYIHSNNIIHRDIKPENLLCTKKIDLINLKLTDFGLAKEANEPLFTICGTKTYVAPEILKGKGYGIAVDIWAAGIICYVLLCGFPPFTSLDHNRTELFELIISGKFEYPNPYWNDISEESKNLINCMLVVDPNNRFTVFDCLSHPWILTLGNTIKFTEPITDIIHQERDHLKMKASIFQSNFQNFQNFK